MFTPRTAKVVNVAPASVDRSTRYPVSPLTSRQLRMMRLVCQLVVAKVPGVLGRLTAAAATDGSDRAPAASSARTW